MEHRRRGLFSCAWCGRSLCPTRWSPQITNERAELILAMEARLDPHWGYKMGALFSYMDGFE